MLPGVAVAEQEGWHYSPLPGEGDRASMGCARESDQTSFACIVVRCEDDFSTGLYVHTSRAEGDAGEWRVTIDRDTRDFSANRSAAPYGARLAGDQDWLLNGLKRGGLAFLDRATGEPLPKNAIPLRGSLYAINEALAHCAPRI